MGPLQKEIAAYMHRATIRIGGPWTSAAELKQWWHSQYEKDMRSSLVLVGNTPEYQKLYAAFLARGNAIAAGSHIVLERVQ